MSDTVKEERAIQIMATLLTLQAEAIEGGRAPNDGARVMADIRTELLGDENLLGYVLHGMAGCLLAFENMLCETTGRRPGQLLNGVISAASRGEW